MTGRLIPCIGQDGEFASDKASRQAACKWLGDLIDEGKRRSEARGELAHYYAAAGLEESIAHAKSKAAKDLIKPWLIGLAVKPPAVAAPAKKGPPRSEVKRGSRATLTRRLPASDTAEAHGLVPRLSVMPEPGNTVRSIGGR